MAVDKKQITDFLQGNKKLVVIVLVAVLIAYGVFSSKSPNKNAPTSTPAVPGKGNVTETDRLLSVIDGLKKDVDELKKNQGITKQNVTPGSTGVSPKPSESEQKKNQSLTELQKFVNGGRSDESQERKPWEPKQGVQPGVMLQQPQQIQPKPENRLIKIDISPVESAAKETKKESSTSSDDLYLPAGSFVSFTLTSSVFAPDSGTEMPTSGVLDAAFVGPNKSTVPMKGCFFIGKAKGNTAERIADIKPVRLSCVWPNGETSEVEITGYVTDIYGTFGLPGEVDRHTGTFLSTVGITSALEGLSQGMKQAQTISQTALSTSASVTSTNIGGSSYQYGGYAALGDLTTAAKSFFAAQMQNLIPTVKIKPGERGYIRLTAGVKIAGGRKNVAGNLKSYPYINNLSSAR